MVGGLQMSVDFGSQLPSRDILPSPAGPVHAHVCIGRGDRESHPRFSPNSEFLNLNTTDTLGPINVFV